LHHESACSHERAPKAEWASPRDRHSQLASKRSIQNRSFEAAKFGVGVLLGTPEGCGLNPHNVEVGKDTMLLVNSDYCERQSTHITLGDFLHDRACAHGINTYVSSCFPALQPIAANK
jgi:hypothetical protein